MAANNHKGSRVTADISVLRKRDADALDAVFSSALAEDFKCLLVADFNDSLINLAEHHLVLCAAQLRHELNVQRFRITPLGYPPELVGGEIEGLQRIIRACRETVDDMRSGRSALAAEDAASLERVCDRLQERLSVLLAQTGEKGREDSTNHGM